MRYKYTAAVVLFAGFIAQLGAASSADKFECASVTIDYESGVAYSVNYTSCHDGENQTRNPGYNTGNRWDDGAVGQPLWIGPVGVGSIDPTKIYLRDEKLHPGDNVFKCRGIIGTDRANCERIS